jgi:hypothetical protein
MSTVYLDLYSFTDLRDRRARPRLGGGVSFERHAPERLEIPHRVYESMEEDEQLAAPELIEPLDDLFVRLAGAFDAFYGFSTHSKLPWQQRVELVEAARRGEPVPRYPTVAPDRTVGTSNGGRVVWAAETPFLYDEWLSSSADYPWKQPFHEALGRDTFVHRQQVQLGNVPSFDDHRRLVRRADGQTERSPKR